MRSRMGLGMFTFDVPSSEPARPNRWMLHQAANDGFRGVLLMCFDGPDADSGPRGLVVLANGDLVHLVRLPDGLLRDGPLPGLVFFSRRLRAMSVVFRTS